MGNSPSSGSSSASAPAATGSSSKKSGKSSSSKHKEKQHPHQSSPQMPSTPGSAAAEMASRAQRVVGDLQAGLQSGIQQLEENDHPAAQLLDSMCGPYLDHAHGVPHHHHHHAGSKTSSSKKGKKGKQRYYEDDEEDEDLLEEEEESLEDEETEYSGTQVTLSEDETSYRRRRRGGRRDDNETVESASYFESDYDNSTMPGRSRVDESSYDETTTDGETSATRQFSGVVTHVEEIHDHDHHRSRHRHHHHSSSNSSKQPLASAFAKRCYFTKAGIGKTTQHYEGLTLTGNVVLMLAAAMKLKGCPTICDEDLRRVEQTYPNQFSRLPDELLLSSGWRRISKYCHFSNKPIPDGVPFFHSKQRVHSTGGYYFLLAAAVGMVRPIDVEPLNRDTLVLLETDYPTACDNAPPILIQDPAEWTLVDKFCFFSGGPINTDEDVYYQADFEGSAIYMLAFLSPSLTPAELYKLDSGVAGLETVAAVQEVEAVYDLTERDFDDLKLYHLGPCRALPPYILQPQAWTKVLPPHFLEAREQALIQAKDYDPNMQFAPPGGMPYAGEPQQIMMVAAEEPNYYNPAYGTASQQQFVPTGVPVPTPQGLRPPAFAMAASSPQHMHPSPMMMMPSSGPQTLAMMAPSPPADPQRMMMTMMTAPPPQQQQGPVQVQQPVSNVDPPAVDSMRMEMQRQVEEEGAFGASNTHVAAPAPPPPPPDSPGAIAGSRSSKPYASSSPGAAVERLPAVEPFTPTAYSETKLSTASYRDSPSIGVDPPESTVFSNDGNDDNEEEDEPPSLSKHQEYAVGGGIDDYATAEMEDDEGAPSDEPPGVLSAERNLDNVATSAPAATYLDTKQAEEEKKKYLEKENPMSPLSENEYSYGPKPASPLPPNLAIDPQASEGMYSESASEFTKSPTDGNLPPRSPNSEYSQSSAMKGAQEMLRRNRQRRLLDAARRKRDGAGNEQVASMEADTLSPRSDDGASAATWDTSSEMSGSSSIWTDHTGDRGSRRALILQMARTRMRKSTHAKNPGTEPIPTAEEPPSLEEEKKVDSMRDGSDIDLAGELD